jgi:hypothetical protein
MPQLLENVKYVLEIQSEFFQNPQLYLLVEVGMLKAIVQNFRNHVAHNPDLLLVLGVWPNVPVIAYCLLPL